MYPIYYILKNIQRSSGIINYMHDIFIYYAYYIHYYTKHFVKHNSYALRILAKNFKKQRKNSKKRQKNTEQAQIAIFFHFYI